MTVAEPRSWLVPAAANTDFFNPDKSLDLLDSLISRLADDIDGGDPLAGLDDMGIVAQRDILTFTQRLYPDYQPSAHHRLLSEKLNAVERGEIQRLIVTMPPRFGKSELCSVNFPAYYLGRNPDRRVIACSHTNSLAYTFSRQARSKIRHHGWPFPRIRLSKQMAQVQSWDIEAHRGGYLAAGVGGPITGRGANLLMIDDPHKSAEEAQSAKIRERIWEWYRGTALTRLEPNGAVVIIATRWHNDDLIGRVLNDENADEWEMLHLPALSLPADLRPGGDPDPLGRADNAPLWPERYTTPMLERKRREVGSYQFSAQFQGVPVDDDLAIINKRWWRYYDQVPALSQGPYLFLDTAFKTGKHNDYSVIAVWGVGQDGNFYGLDVWRGQVTFPALRRRTKAMFERWRPEQIYIEDAASGQSLIQALTEEHLPVIAYKPERDKVSRIHAVSPFIEGGRVLLPNTETVPNSEWVDPFVFEHAAFPFGEHDDQVDTTAMMLLRLARHNPIEAMPDEIEDVLEELGL